MPPVPSGPTGTLVTVRTGGEMMDLEEKVGCGVLGYLVWGWLHGDYEEWCCLSCAGIGVPGHRER